MIRIKKSAAVSMISPSHLTQLADPSHSPQMAPEVVLRNQEVAAVKQVAAGGYAYMYEGHSAVLSGAGEVVVWGWNAFGQLGIGEVSGGSAIPARNVWLAKQHVRQLAAGQFATAAVTDAGEVFTWGLNGTISALPTAPARAVQSYRR